MTSGGDLAPEGQCPFCGELVRSQSSLEEEGSSRSPETAPAGFTDASSSEATTDWVTTWTRGSLGTLGRFQLRERLGDGGFGQVFLAYDPRLDRDVALKVLKQPDPSERVMERFFREARAAARLDHPNIVSVHDAGFDNGCCWVAYQCITGRPLLWYRDHHRLDPRTSARILRELADAVDHAHHQGVLHRDLKPANILIDDLGRPRLIDFGLARRSDLDSSLTRDGAVVGTPAYMSPEQALGFSRNVDERSDVFSLGVIFFEILTGQRHQGLPSCQTVAGTDTGISGTDKPISYLPRSPKGSTPRALERICLKAMAASPQERYPSARALADDLDQWLYRHEAIGWRPPVAARKVAMAMAAALLLCIGAWGMLMTWRLSGRWGQRQTVQSPSVIAPAKLMSRPDAEPAPEPPPVSIKTPSAKGQGTEPQPGKAHDKQELVGNRETRTYHLALCKRAATIYEKNRVALKDAEQAAALGWKPCTICNPPTSPPRDRAGGDG